MKFWAGARN